MTSPKNELRNIYRLNLIQYFQEDELRPVRQEKIGSQCYGLNKRQMGKKKEVVVKYTMNKQRDEDWELDLIAGEERPLIPEGRYTAQCVRCERSQSHYNSLKLFLTFKIIDGEFMDVELFMAMNLIDSRTMKPFRKIPAGSKYYKNWTIANHNMRPNRQDRMSPKIFQNAIFEIQVRTVKPRYPDGKDELPEGFQYSVVDFIIRRLQ